jgi:ABC-type Mn2+/Zn2+ transport system permease subunit
MNVYLLTETLFCFLLILFLMLCSRLKNETNIWVFFVTGLALGLATLTRPWTQGFIFLLLPALSLTLTQQRLFKPLILLTGFARVCHQMSIKGILKD